MRYRELEFALAQVIGVYPEKRGRFQARLKQLQRMGFPEGINAGRSSRAEYGASHIFKLAMVLELLQIGITPERAISSIRRWWDVTRRGLISARQNAKAVSIVFLPKDFGGFQSAGEVQDDDAIAWTSDGCSLLTIDNEDKPDADTARRVFAHPRSVVLNLSSIFSEVMAGLESAGVPSADIFTEMDQWAGEHDIFGRPLDVGPL